MPTLTNTTSDNLKVPILARVIEAGETVEIDVKKAIEFLGHPHLHLDEETEAELAPVLPVAPIEPDVDRLENESGSAAPKEQS